MYRLLIVDDEPHIVDGLFHSVDWGQLNIQEVYRASSADRAISILQRHHVDVLLTDIYMPGLSGLELAEIVTRRWPYTKIIFLSGHQEFVNAQQAVKLGAFRYLIKPLLSEEIMEVVAEALAALDEDLTNLSVVKEAAERMEQLRENTRQNMIMNWLEWGDESIFTAQESLPGLTFPGVSREGYGFILLLRPEAPCENLSSTTYRHLSLVELSKKIFGEILSPVEHLTHSGLSALLYFHSCEQELREFHQTVLERLDSFQRSSAQSLPATVAVFWSHPLAIDQLQKYFSPMRKRAERFYLAGKEAVVGPELLLPDHDERDALPQQELLLQYLETLQREPICQTITYFFSQPSLTQNTLVAFYHVLTGSIIFDSLQRGFSLSEWSEGEESAFFEGIYAATSVAEFEVLALGAVNQYLDYVEQEGVSQHRRLVIDTMTHIDRHLSEDITVGTVAEHFSYHPNYLSQLFKQETGQTLQEYIIEQRIELAKSLLKEGQKVGEVAAAVGYESAPYFSRLFKQTVGVSPKQYQQ